MMKRAAVHGAFAGVWLVVSACSGDPADPGPIRELPRQLTVTEREIIRNTNAFGWDLFRRVQAAEAAPNVFLSPLSASMALGMTMNGAAGGTWEGMKTGLRLDGLSEQEINESFRGLLDLLLDLDSRVTLRIGNSVWSRQGFPFEAAFFNTVRDYFDAQARELDFADPRSVDVINAWARDATNGRIDRVLQSIAPHHIMFLINAIYFKGRWQRPFDPRRTQPAPFRRADGSSTNVPMMSLPATRVPYARTAALEAVELGYGGGAFTMVLVLPAPGRTLEDLLGSLDATAWSGLIGALDSASVEVRIPRFRFEYETLLNQPLIDMGMRTAFSAAADFIRLTPAARTDPVCIHFVKQNSFVEVNEEGTEAAAVTTVGASVTSAPPSFTADRPFLFVIRERLSDTILFVGAIGDPTVEEGEPAREAPPPCTA